MSIEFPCTQCGKLLRVGDDAAGKQARCPSCSAVQEIPSSTRAHPNPFGAAPLPTSAPPVGENPYQAPTSAPWYPAHEASLTQSTPIDAGDILNRAWIIFKSDFWTMALVGFVFWICQFGFNMVVGQVVNLSLFAAGGGPPDEAVIIGSQLVIQTLGFLFGTWLEVGMAIYMLKTARGESASLGDLFSGARFFPAAVAARFIYFIGIIFGMLLFIVPGAILALMFGQYIYLVVDRGQPTLESLGTSKNLTAGNKVQLFVVWLATVGIGMVGALVCCVGVWPAMAFIELLWAVAYLSMTGQPTADEILMRPPAATPFAAPPSGELR